MKKPTEEDDRRNIEATLFGHQVAQKAAEAAIREALEKASREDQSHFQGAIMETAITKKTFSAPVELGVADAVVAGLRQRLEGASAETPAGYQIVRRGIGECRSLRGQVKQAHKDLKQSALEWGRACDAELRRVTGLIEDVELPLRAEKQRVDDEKLRIKREKEEAERLEREEQERVEREEREKSEAAEREEREKAEAAEREIIRQQQKAEWKRLEEETAKLREQRMAQERKQREEEELLAIERKKVEDEKAAIREALEKERRDQEAKLAAEEQARIEAEEREAAERLREERKPDTEKLEDLAGKLSDYELPEVSTAWAESVLDQVDSDLENCALKILNAIGNP
jgi:hypothetical protein